MTGSCWQYLLKTEEVEALGTVGLETPAKECVIEPIDQGLAGDFIKRYEWMGTIGSSIRSFGLFAEGHLVAVVGFGPARAPNAYSRMLGQDLARSVIQLCRGASSPQCPKWGPSRLISHALKHPLLAQKYKIAVAFADPEAGEIGTIYQACNAIYSGLTDSHRTPQYIICGETLDPRRVVARYGSRARSHLLTVDAKYRSVPIPAKHRYFLAIGGGRARAGVLRELSRLALPYPKRYDAASIPTFQTGSSLSLVSQLEENTETI